MRDLAKVRTETERRICALTLPGDDPGQEAFERAFTILKRRWTKTWPEIAAHWKKEPQKRGALHVHLVVYFDGTSLESEERFRLWLMEQWHLLIGAGDERHLRWHVHETNWEKPRGSFAGYFAKYIGKQSGCEHGEITGRWWGHVSRRSIPYGERIQIEIDPSEAVKVYRWARKYRQRKAEIAHRKRLRHRLTDGAPIDWENLCSNRCGTQINPDVARHLRLVFKQMAQHVGLSWARPRLPKNNGVFLTFPGSAVLVRRVIDHAQKDTCPFSNGKRILTLRKRRGVLSAGIAVGSRKGSG